MKKHLNKSMVEFVLEQKSKLGIGGDTYSDFSKKVINYANALSKTPRLGHFIPCDHNDIPLQKPIEYSGMDSDALYDVEQYQLACDRVLFEGCKYDSQRKAVVCNAKYIFYVGYYVLYEDLIKHNLPLTDNGAKFFGL